MNSIFEIALDKRCKTLSFSSHQFFYCVKKTPGVKIFNSSDSVFLSENDNYGQKAEFVGRIDNSISKNSIQEKGLSWDQETFYKSNLSRKSPNSDFTQRNKMLQLVSRCLPILDHGCETVGLSFALNDEF